MSKLTFGGPDRLEVCQAANSPPWREWVQRRTRADVERRRNPIGATLANPSEVVLALHGMHAMHALELLLCPPGAPQGVVDLTAAQVGGFHDEPVSWSNSLRLRELTRKAANDGVAYGIVSTG